MKSAVAPQPAQQNVDVKMQATKTDILEPDSLNLLVFLLGAFHLCKSATQEQTNLVALSGPSEAPANLSLAPPCRANSAELTV